MRLPRSENLSHVLHAVRQTIPLKLIIFLEGVVRGNSDLGSPDGEPPLEITEDDFLLMHLIPDSKHFHPKELEKKEWSKNLRGEAPSSSVACTSLLDRDDQGYPILGRNMDWIPFGDGGGESVVMAWIEDGVAVWDRQD